METRERNIKLFDNAEDVAVSKRAVGEVRIEEVLIGKQTGEWAEVLLNRVHRTEVEVENPKWLPTLKRKQP